MFQLQGKGRELDRMSNEGRSKEQLAMAAKNRFNPQEILNACNRAVKLVIVLITSTLNFSIRLNLLLTFPIHHHAMKLINPFAT